MDARPVVDLDFEDVRAGLADGSLILVDVREDAEVTSGAIPGSISMPLSRFDPDALPAAPAKVVFSCAAGMRSRIAIDLCRRAGLPHATHYVGGFKDWVAAGGPVERGTAGE